MYSSYLFFITSLPGNKPFLPLVGEQNEMIAIWGNNKKDGQCQTALQQLEKLKTKNGWKMETHQKQTCCPFFSHFSSHFWLHFSEKWNQKWELWMPRIGMLIVMFFCCFCCQLKNFRSKNRQKMATVNFCPLGCWKNRGKISFSSDVACWQWNQHVCTLPTHVSVLRVTCHWHFATVYVLDSINGLPKYI